MDENGKLGVNGGEPYKSLVTDGEGTAKWEDRLAYVAPEEQVIFSRENIAFTESGGTYDSDTMPITAISVGEKYYVDFDGETYDCIAHTMRSGVPDPVIIGNSSIVGGLEDTGEPFCMFYSIEDQKIQIVTTLTSPTHTVSISRVGETVHTIPQKFLPDQPVFYYDEDGRLVDAEGVEMTPEQAKAVGLNFIIQSDSSVARPISAWYDDDNNGVSFYVAKVVNAITGRFELDIVRVGIPLPG